MKNIWYLACMLFALSFMASCEDTDALKDDIQSLTDRVAALESKVTQLNENLASLHILLQEGIIISNLEYDAVNEKYTLTLSDGTVLDLAEHNETFGNAPLVGVDADGYWQVSYNNGVSWQPVLQGDSQVLAVGEDGVTPLFRASADGYWEISYDGGATYSRVKDEAGNDVKAVYDSETSTSQVFSEAEVSEDGNSLILTLANGTTVNIPIVPDFFCYFDESITGEQKIAEGETRNFNLHIKGADHTVITTPMGWKATLAEADPATDVAVLTVTAPGTAAAETKATADNTRDISVMALKGGFAAIAKLQVNPIEVSIGGGDEPGGDEEPDVPDGTLDLGSLINSSMSFTQLERWQDDKLTDAADYWFTRVSAITTVSYDAAESAIKADNTTARGAWATTSFGYHCGSTTFERADYRLTFEFKSTIAGSGVLAVTVRGGADDKSFRVINLNNGLRNAVAFNVADAEVNTYKTITVELDFTQADANTNLNNHDSFQTTTEADVNGISIYFFNNLSNASSAYTTYVRNIKLEKIQ